MPIRHRWPPMTHLPLLHLKPLALPRHLEQTVAEQSDKVQQIYKYSADRKANQAQSHQQQWAALGASGACPLQGCGLDLEACPPAMGRF